MKTIHVKRSFALAASAFAITSAFVGCRDYIPFDEEDIKSADFSKHYDDAFVQLFGEPAENHNWGMTLLEPINFSSGDMTRAVDNNVNVNRNQWCERNTSGYNTQDYVLANTIKVPGWPNFDGYYYGNNGSSTFGGVYKHDDIFTGSGLQVQPCGDVTDYEINYVSTWFRTHKNPISEPLHLTDFFIQNISQDNDQLFYNNAIDLGGTSMQQGLPGGYPKTSQIGPDGNPRSPWWNGDNAKFVNDVVLPNTNDRRTNIGNDIQVEHQLSHLNSNESLNYSVDYLHFKSMDGNAYAQGFTPDDGWTHINNFNYGNSNFNPEDVVDRGFREIKYVHSSGTEDFACRSSMANQNSWIHDWVLVHLTWKEPGADGVVRDREGYYLGFDFSNSTNDTKISRDGFYSNWIIKISPAYFAKNETKTARVMCEDLGGAFDYDFNDIVFDVAYDGNKKEAIICLQASGGTLPIVAGGLSDIKYEAHYMLGQSNTDTPVNVDASNGASHEVAIYRIPATGYLTDDKLDFKKIPVLVKFKGESEWTNTNDLRDQSWTDSSFGDHHAEVQDGTKTPRKFATAIGVNWMKEFKCIKEGYQKFILWVVTPSYSYEVDVSGSDGNATGQKQTLYWYDDITKKEWIHQGPKDPVISSSDPSLNPVQWQSLATINVSQDFNLKNKAVDYITIASYSGDNSIIDQLKSKKLNEPVTFAYITKAPTSLGTTGVHGMIFPIWIIDSKPYYVKPDGSKTEITETILKTEASYRTATWQSTFVRSGANGANTPSTDMGQGVDADGNYTFVTKYGYTVADLYVDLTPDNSDNTKTYCDYIAFYVLEDVDSNPYSIAAVSGSQGMMGNDGDVKKYECYVIF